MSTNGALSPPTCPVSVAGVPPTAVIEALMCSSSTLQWMMIFFAASGTNF
jgi:hypothetical protein